MPSVRVIVNLCQLPGSSVSVSASRLKDSAVAYLLVSGSSLYGGSHSTHEDCELRRALEKKMA